MTAGRIVPDNNGAVESPTEASAWRHGGLYRLPSGHIARLRRPGLMAMLARGQIPNPLASRVTKLLVLTTEEEIKGRTQEQREQALLSNCEAFLGIAALTFQEPRLILDREPDYGQGEIGPEDISDRDLLWVFYDFVEGSAADVAQFHVARRAAQPGRSSK